jgi:CDP-2,3-bis-(O-geranylgeranyl)-sn-glycerol synthase
MQYTQVLLLLLTANGAPIVATYLLGSRFAKPVDLGIELADGQRLLGETKTVRGVLAAIAFTACMGLVAGPSWQTGALAGALAMGGDLLSSFVKRRLRIPPSGKAPGLDQIPEALLPLAVLHEPLALGYTDIAICVTLFLLIDITLSRLLYRLHIRKRPY